MAIGKHTGLKWSLLVVLVVASCLLCMNGIELGLDLKGGLSVTVEVDTNHVSTIYRQELAKENADWSDQELDDAVAQRIELLGVDSGKIVTRFCPPDTASTSFDSKAKAWDRALTGRAAAIAFLSLRASVTRLR